MTPAVNTATPAEPRTKELYCAVCRPDCAHGRHAAEDGSMRSACRACQQRAPPPSPTPTVAHGEAAGPQTVYSSCRVNVCARCGGEAHGEEACATPEDGGERGRMMNCRRCGVRFMAEGGVTSAMQCVGFNSQIMPVVLSICAIDIGLQLIVESRRTNGFLGDPDWVPFLNLPLGAVMGYPVYGGGISYLSIACFELLPDLLLPGQTAWAFLCLCFSAASIARLTTFFMQDFPWPWPLRTLITFLMVSFSLDTLLILSFLHLVVFVLQAMRASFRPYDDPDSKCFDAYFPRFLKASGVLVVYPIFSGGLMSSFIMLAASTTDYYGFLLLFLLFDFIATFLFSWALVYILVHCLRLLPRISRAAEVRGALKCAALGCALLGSQQAIYSLPLSSFIMEWVWFAYCLPIIVCGGFLVVLSLSQTLLLGHVKCVGQLAPPPLDGNERVNLLR